MTKPLQLTDNQKTEILKLAQQTLPSNYTIFVYGSRAQGTAMEYSDLDLAITAKQGITTLQMEAFKEALSESEIPFLVDVINLDDISREFRAAIDHDLQQLNTT